jgi:DNA-binding MarR family transcriptional regulator
MNIMGDGFTPLESGAWGGFLGTYSQMMAFIEADLQENWKITHVEFEILLYLSWEPNHRMRIQDLAARSILTRSGMSRAVERLGKAGLVRCETASEDRRGAYAVLTQEGEARMQSALGTHVALVRENFLNLFSPSQLEQMAEFWQQIEKHLAEKK